MLELGSETVSELESGWGGRDSGAERPEELVSDELPEEDSGSLEDAGAGPVVRDVLCTESVIADLRYATVLEDGVRVKVGLPLNPAGADLQEKEGGHGANCPGAAA